MTVHVTTVPTDIPDDFGPAVAPYDAIHRQVCARLFNTHDPHPLWMEYAGAWNGVVYRFVACAEHDEGFRAAILGPDSDSKTRYRQDFDLFGFFITGLSCLECFTYGVHAILARHPTAGSVFPMETEDHRKAVSPMILAPRVESAFPGDQLARRLTAVVTSVAFKEWSKARNVLAHRAHPGRTFSYPPIGPTPGLWQLQNLPISDDLTTNRRAWLAGALADLLNDAERLITREFP